MLENEEGRMVVTLLGVWLIVFASKIEHIILAFSNLFVMLLICFSLSAKYVYIVYCWHLICHLSEGQIWRYIPKLLCGCKEHAEMCICSPKYIRVSRRQNNEDRERCWGVSTLFHSLLYRAACNFIFWFPLFIFILCPFSCSNFLFVRRWHQGWRLKWVNC